MYMYVYVLLVTQCNVLSQLILQLGIDANDICHAFIAAVMPRSLGINGYDVTDDGIKPTWIIPIIQIQGTCNDFENIIKFSDQWQVKFITLNTRALLHER